MRSIGRRGKKTSIKNWEMIPMKSRKNELSIEKAKAVIVEKEHNVLRLCYWTEFKSKAW